MKFYTQLKSVYVEGDNVAAPYGKNPPPPNWGRIEVGEAALQAPEVFARFPLPTLPRVGGGEANE